MIQLSEKDHARLWSYVEVHAPDECWPWTGSIKHNKCRRPRPQMTVWNGTQQTNLSVQRYIYYIYNNKDIDGKQIYPKCRNPLCCNPAHLAEGTHADTISDRPTSHWKVDRATRVYIYNILINKRATVKEVAEQYHLSTSRVLEIRREEARKNGLDQRYPIKMTHETAQQIVDDKYKHHMKHIDIAQKYGVSPATVSRVVNGTYYCRSKEKVQKSVMKVLSS